MSAKRDAVFHMVDEALASCVALVYVVLELVDIRDTTANISPSLPVMELTSGIAGDQIRTLAG